MQIWVPGSVSKRYGGIIKETEFLKLYQDFANEQLTIMHDASKDYASEEDRLANFKRLAERLNVSPLLIWAVYFTKHVDSILSYINTGRMNRDSVRGRFLDIANY